MSRPAWIGLDGAERDLTRMEHVLHEAAAIVGPAPDLASTHVVAHGGRHAAGALHYLDLSPLQEDAVAEWAGTRGLALTILHPDRPARVEGPIERRSGAAEAAERLRERLEGRACRFPGQDQIPAAVMPSQLLRLSAIDRVVALGTQIAPADVIEEAGYLRPRFEDGALVLHVTPLGPGRFRPFELAVSHDCCDAG